MDAGLLQRYMLELDLQFLEIAFCMS
uniref:Uncharacterized protein n=1 Tax=Rhizophora mucronata TaxID=61149 RepID=A0A2P2N2M0_RHIMU